MTDGKVIDYESESFDYEFKFIIKDITKRSEAFMDLQRKLAEAQIQLEKQIHANVVRGTSLESGSYITPMQTDLEELRELRQEQLKLQHELEESRAEVDYLLDESVKREEEVENMRVQLVDATDHIDDLRNAVKVVSRLL